MGMLIAEGDGIMGGLNTLKNSFEFSLMSELLRGNSSIPIFQYSFMQCQLHPGRHFWQNLLIVLTDTVTAFDVLDIPTVTVTNLKQQEQSTNQYGSYHFQSIVFQF